MTTLKEARETFDRNEMGLLYEAVIDVLRARQKNHALESEADYLAGAMAVLNHVFPNQDGPDKMSNEIPVAWIMFPMAGRSVLDAYKDREMH
jgi:hypothetical protein